MRSDVMAKLKRLGAWLKQLDRDEGGAMSVEKILILAVIALPILIILLAFRHTISDWFTKQSNTLSQNSN
jgi:Flp pilus assembly pilin Flp